MNTAMSKYVRLTKGFGKGILMLPEEVNNSIDTSSDYYMSVYRYNQAQYNKFQSTGSVAGIRDVVTNIIVFDFDSSNKEEAREDAVTLTERLLAAGVPEDCIQAYFSGNKGFHILISTDKEMTPDLVKELAVDKFGKDLKTLDSKIYDPARVLRVPGTLNKKSNLYKIPLTLWQLKNETIEEIEVLASDLDNITEEFNWQTFSPSNEFLTPVVSQPKVEVKPKIEVEQSIKEALADCPRHWKKWKWALAKGLFESGERHHALLILAATCRGLGYDRDQALALCTSAIQKQADRTNSDPFSLEELEDNIIESVYSSTWTGGQYSPASDPMLKALCEKLDIPLEIDISRAPMKIGEITDGYVDFIQHIDENTVTTGIRLLDESVPITTGMNVGIIGSPSSGKTAISLNILKHTSQNNVLTVFASLDMHRNRLYEKLLLKVSNLPRKELYKRIKDGKAQDIFDKVQKEYGNVWFYDRSSPTTEDIRRYILDVQEQTGRKVKLLVIDYFERVTSERSDETAASKDVASKLQDLMNDLNLAVITLVQPNKFSMMGGPDQPITNYNSIKGSSFLAQSFRAIISLWRPFFNPEWKEHDKFMQMAILKNDLGELGMLNFSWHGRTGEIGELTEEQEEELYALIAEKEEAAKQKNKDDY